MFVLGATCISLNPLPALDKVVPLKVKPASASNVFAVPEPVINLLFALLLIVVALPPDAVTVTIPAEIADTSKFVEKLIVPAVPTVEPSCLTIIPEPDAVIPVSAEPSSAGSAPVNCAEGRFVKDAPEPLNVVAVATPVMTTP